MELEKRNIQPGMQANEELYGYKGIVRKVFSNFWSITDEYIQDKTEWLNIQIVPIDAEERLERWIVIDTLDGDQIVAPESRVKIFFANTFDVKGIFLQNRMVLRDSLQENIRPMKDYTLAWLETKKCWMILPKIHWN